MKVFWKNKKIKIYQIWIYFSCRCSLKQKGKFQEISTKMNIPWNFLNCGINPRKKFIFFSNLVIKFSQKLIFISNFFFSHNIEERRFFQVIEKWEWWFNNFSCSCFHKQSVKYKSFVDDIWKFCWLDMLSILSHVGLVWCGWQRNFWIINGKNI